MKKFLTIIILFNTTLPALSFEDLMIISKSPVKKVSVQDEAIVNVRPVFTIYNEKKILLVTPIKTGKTKIITDTTDGQEILEINISKKKTNVKPNEKFDYFSMDMPPEAIEIPEPPTYTEQGEQK